MANFIIHTKKNGKQEKYYQAYCPNCQKDKGFVRKSRINNLCQECGGKKAGLSNIGKVGPNKGKIFSEEVRQKMSKSKEGYIPWNKGKKETRLEVLEKISQSKLDQPVWNPGLPMDLEQKETVGANQPKKELYLLTGAPGSGKSWVLSNLSNFDCLDSDSIPKKELVPKCNSVPRPLLTLTVGVSTFIKRNPDFDIKIIVIIESIDTLNQRILSRGGVITPTIEKRAKRMEALAKQAIFFGSSQEVLDFLKKSHNRL